MHDRPKDWLLGSSRLRSSTDEEDCPKIIPNHWCVRFGRGVCAVRVYNFDDFRLANVLQDKENGRLAFGPPAQSPE